MNVKYPNMVGGKCHRCTLLFDGSGCGCWCAWCHGMWVADLLDISGSVMKAAFKALGDDTEHFTCPDCGRSRECARASHHNSGCEW